MASTANIVIVGFSFVLCILGALALLTALIGRCFVHFTPEPKKPSPAAAPVAPLSPNDARLLPVIAAAVHCAVGKRPHKIVSIQSTKTD